MVYYQIKKKSMVYYSIISDRKQLYTCTRHTIGEQHILQYWQQCPIYYLQLVGGKHHQGFHQLNQVNKN